MSAKRDQWFIADTLITMLLLALFLLPKELKITGSIIIVLYTLVKFVILYKTDAPHFTPRVKKALSYFVIVVLISLYFVYFY